MVHCFVCNNAEGVLVAIGLYEGEVYYICKHGHIDAATYDIETGFPAWLTSSDDDDEPHEELVDTIKSVLPQLLDR